MFSRYTQPKLLNNIVNRLYCNKASQDLSHLIKANHQWANTKLNSQPELFKKLSCEQPAKILWIGCSDSRVPETTILQAELGDIFVHRVVGNLIRKQDTGLLAALQFSLKVLKVDHIILCGHYDCGGVKASFQGSKLKHVDNWIEPLMQLYKENEKQLNENYNNEEDKIKQMCHLNVLKGIKDLSEIPIVKESLDQVKLHGWIYDVSNGRIKDLLNK